MSDSSSELSSVPSEDESDLKLERRDGILKFFSKAAPKPAPTKVEDEPPQPEREPSPPHEYVLGDNPDIAFIVMFRSRFNEAFPKSLPNFGPQELERGVVDSVPGEHVEQLLCALLGLLLNRKQDVKPGHYNRALEEAVQTHKAQWAKDWESKNPLSGGATFTSMTPTQRLTLLRTLTLWALSSSDSVRAIIATSYKQNRHEDDLNQPLSIQPWGSDSYRRRYFLIEGLDDTGFRVYRESNPAGIKRTWWSVAGDIEELRQLAEKLLNKDGGQKARLLSGKINAAIPRFEATEEKRKRREYRQMRKQQFKRPEPNFSMYEGRTRGKRIKYTYSDDEDDIYSDSTSRRSTRNTGTHTPAEPTVTQSGRQVRARVGGAYGESVLSGTHSSSIPISAYDGVDDGDEEDLAGRRPRRAAATAANNGLNGWAKGGEHIEGYNSVDEMDDEEDASEQDYGDDEEDDHLSIGSDGDDDQDDISDEDIDMDDELDDLHEKKSLVVKLPVKTPTPEKAQPTNTHFDPPKEAQEEVTNGAKQETAPIKSQEIPQNSIQPPVEQDRPVLEATTGTNGSVTESTPIHHEAYHPKHDIAIQSINPVPSAEDTHPRSAVVKDDHELQYVSSNPDNVPSSTPISPSLAFRGTPEKPHSLPHSINVGQGNP